MDPYCGLCAGAETPPGGATEIDVGGNATVNGSGSSHNVGGRTVAGGRYCKKNDNSNLMPMAAVASTGIVKTNGSPNVFTPDGGSTAIQQNADATSPSWQVMTLSDSDMVTLKAMAKARGTYYQPTSPGGKVTFTSPPPNGIVFVDTYSGNPLTPSSPSSDLSVPLVDIHGWGNAAPFKGWLIAAGTIDVSGNIAVDGLIYSQNDITLHGTGNGTIAGAVISTNRVDTTKSNVDATDIGNNPIVYDCLNVRSGGGSSARTGSWRRGAIKRSRDGEATARSGGDRTRAGAGRLPARPGGPAARRQSRRRGAQGDRGSAVGGRGGPPPRRPPAGPQEPVPPSQPRHLRHLARPEGRGDPRVRVGHRPRSCRLGGGEDCPTLARCKQGSETDSGRTRGGGR